MTENITCSKRKVLRIDENDPVDWQIGRIEVRCVSAFEDHVVCNAHSLGLSPKRSRGNFPIARVCNTRILRCPLHDLAQDSVITSCSLLFPI